MLSTNEKLAHLRGTMKACGADACLIPSSDPHLSEYLPGHWQARSYFSGPLFHPGRAPAVRQ